MRNKKFEEIENLLSALLLVLSETEYVNLIHANEALKKYDFILSKIENGEYKETKRNEISLQDLETIISYLKEKMANQ